MDVRFIVQEDEHGKLSFILDADITQQEKDAQLIQYLHNLVASAPDQLKAPVKPFVWDPDQMHPYIKEHGPMLCWLDGNSKEIQAFVEHMSNTLGYMFDWAYQAGRAHIDYDPDGAEALVHYLEDNPEPWTEFNCRRIG